jgi:hypothetical protein
MNFPVFSQLAGNFGDGFLFIAADTETICCTRFANRSASHASKNCLATAVIFAMSSPFCLRVVAGLAPIGAWHPWWLQAVFVGSITRSLAC